jgi:deoxyribodipyrimidine photo-lyase
MPTAWRRSRRRFPSLRGHGLCAHQSARLKLPTGMSGGAQLFDDFLDRIDRYQETRDFPAVKGPSYLSVHLRFGTVSIRQLAAAAWQQGGAAHRPGCPN